MAATDRIRRAWTQAMSRREFMVRASATSVSPWVLAGATSAGLVPEGWRTEAVDLPVGYLRGSAGMVGCPELMRSLDEPTEPLLDAFVAARDAIGGVEPLEVIPASYLASGDLRFVATPPTLWVHGVLPPGGAGRGDDIVSVACYVTYPVVEVSDVVDKEAHHRYPFQAWALSRGDEAPGGRAVAFTVPVHPLAGLRISLEVESSSLLGGSRRELLEADIVPGWGADRPKLVEGIYLLGLSPDLAGRLPLPATQPFLMDDTAPVLVVSVHRDLDDDPAAGSGCGLDGLQAGDP